VIERVGGRQRIVVDARIVCATNQNLAKCIEEGRFREDLYYRINEVTITIPPLREREGDTLMLANFFLRTYGVQFNRPMKGLSSDAVAALQEYPWRGNVRELENRMKRAVIMTNTTFISASDLELKPPEAKPDLTLNEVRRRAEREAIGVALARTGGNISKAAQLLGISRPTLYDLLADYGLEPRPRDVTKPVLI
jgi:two-component system NtrC family response regulator